MSTSANLALPLCDCVVLRTIFEALPKYECQHGYHYVRENVVEYNEVIATMLRMDRRATELEDQAMEIHQGRLAGAATSTVAAAASKTSEYSAIGGDYWVPAPAQSAAASSDAAASTQVGNKAPVAHKATSSVPERKRPQRSIPKLSPQQTLLAVAAGLVVIALSVFFATSWSSIPTLGQVAVVLFLVASTAVGSVWSKKYFTIISNFLAGLSVLFLGVGLWAASWMGLLPSNWANPSESPYLSFILVVAAGYGLLLGRRFKVFGWLATAPLALTAGLLLFLSVSANNLFAASGQSLSTIDTIKSLLAAAAIFAALAVGRLTRFELADFKVAKKSSKKLSDEEAAAKAENEYQTELHKREQNALRFTYRSTAAVMFAYSVWTFLASAFALMSVGSITDVAQTLAAVPNAFALVVLAAFWWFTARLAGLPRAESMLGGDIKAWIPRATWIYAAAVAYIALTATSVSLSALATSSRTLSLSGILISVALGAVLLFVPGAKFFEKNQLGLIPVRLAAMGSWLLWLGLQVGVLQSQLLLSAWFVLIALVLAAKSFVDRDLRYAEAHFVLTAVGLVLFAFRYSELGWMPSAVLGATLATSLLSLLLYSNLLKRSDASASLLATVVQPIVAVASIFAVGEWVSDVDILMAVTLVFIAVNVLLSLNKKFGASVGHAPIISALSVSVVSYLQLSVLSSIGDSQLNLRMAIFTGVVFVLNLIHSMRSSEKFSSLAAYLPLVIFAYSLNSLALPIQIPFAGFTPFVGLALVLIGHWLVVSKSKNPHNLIEGAALLGYTLVLLDGMQGLFVLALEPSLSNGIVSLPLTVSVLGLVGFGLVPQLIRLTRGELKHFDRRFTMLASLMSLGAALITSLVVYRQSAIVLQLIALAAVSVLTLIAVRSKLEVLRVQSWSYATLFFVPLTAAHLLNSVLFGFGLFEGAGMYVHSLAVPLNILLAALVLRLVGVRLADAGASLSWWIRPVAAAIGAVAGSVAPYVLGNYTGGIALPLPVNQSMLIVDVLAFAVVGLIFTVFRLRDFDHADTQRGVLANTLLTFGFGVAAIQSHSIWVGLSNMTAYVTAPAYDFTSLMLAALILVFAILFIVVAFLKRDAQSSYFGYAFTLVGTTLLLHSTWMVNSFHLLQLYAFAAIASYVLATALLKRASAQTYEVWGWLLPITTLLANVISFSGLTSAPVGNGWVDFAVATLLGYFYIVAVVSQKTTLLGKARNSLLASAGVSWIVAGYLASGAPGAQANLGFTLLLLTVSVGAITLLREVKSLAVVSVSYVALASSAIALGTYLETFGIKVSDGGPELFASLVALTFVINGRVASKAGLLPENLRTLVLHGLPILTVGLPSSIAALNYVAQPIVSLPAVSATRIVALLLIGAVLLVLGLRRGNLGVTIAGGVTFGLTLLPQIWFRIEEFLQGKVQSEIKFAYIAILVYAALTGLQSTFNWRVNSIIVLGVPLAVALVPALYDTVTALDAPAMNTEDWVRFLIVLGGSLVILVLGALRKIAGFFVPGVVGVAVAAVPYLWKPLSQQQWLLWVVLVLVAAVLVWVAIRLEQFKSGVRSANSWLRELK